jgi:hypothetical protein
MDMNMEALISSRRLKLPIAVDSGIDEEAVEAEEEEAMVEVAGPVNTGLVRPVEAGVEKGGTKAMLPLDVIINPPWLMLGIGAEPIRPGRKLVAPFAMIGVEVGFKPLHESSWLLFRLKLSFSEDSLLTVLLLEVKFVFSFFSSSLFFCSNWRIFSLSTSSSLRGFEMLAAGVEVIAFASGRADTGWSVFVLETMFDCSCTTIDMAGSS